MVELAIALAFIIMLGIWELLKLVWLFILWVTRPIREELTFRRMVEEEMRLMISKVMAGRSLAEMDTVALHVEELGDELRRVLHAKVLRQAAHLASDQFKKQFGEEE